MIIMLSRDCWFSVHLSRLRIISLLLCLLVNPISTATTSQPTSSSVLSASALATSLAYKPLSSSSPSSSPALLLANSSGHSSFLSNNIARYKTVYACEGKVLDIHCEEDYLIHLIRANYGRYSISICNDHGNLDWKVDCTSPHSYEVISKRCHSMRDCNITVSSNIFEDHCPGTYKYLEVQYDCLPKVIHQHLESTADGKHWLSKFKPSALPEHSSKSTSTSRPPIIVPITSTTRGSPASSTSASSSSPASYLSPPNGSINLRTFTSTMFPPSTWKPSSDSQAISSTTTHSPFILNHWPLSADNSGLNSNPVTISTSAPWRPPKVSIITGKSQLPLTTPMPNLPMIPSSNNRKSPSTSPSSSTTTSTTTSSPPSSNYDRFNEGPAKRKNTNVPGHIERLPSVSRHSETYSDNHSPIDGVNSENHYSSFPSNSIWNFLPPNATKSPSPSSSHFPISESTSSRTNRARASSTSPSSLIVVTISSIIAILIYSITLLLLIISRITNHRQIVHKNICFVLILSSVILCIISLRLWTESSTCNAIGIVLHFLLQAIFNLIFIDSIRVYCFSSAGSNTNPNPNTTGHTVNNNNHLVNNVNNNNLCSSNTSSNSSASSATSSTSFSSTSPSPASSSASTTAFSAHLEMNGDHSNKAVEAQSPSSTLSTGAQQQPTSASVNPRSTLTDGVKLTSPTLKSALSLISKESITLYLVTYGLPVVTIGTSFLIDPTLIYHGLTPGSIGLTAPNGLLQCWFTSTSTAHLFHTSLWAFLPTFLSIFFTALLILLTIYDKMNHQSTAQSTVAQPASIYGTGNNHSTYNQPFQPPAQQQQQQQQQQPPNLIDYKSGLNNESVAIIHPGYTTQPGHRSRRHRHHHRRYETSWQPTLYVLLLECCFWLMFNVYLTSPATNLPVTIIFSLLNVTSAAALCTITFVRNRKARHNVRKWLLNRKCWLPSFLRYRVSANLSPDVRPRNVGSVGTNGLSTSNGAPMTTCFYSLDPSHLMAPPSPIIKSTSTLSNRSSSRLQSLNMNNTLNHLHSSQPHQPHSGQQPQQHLTLQYPHHPQQQYLRGINAADGSRVTPEVLSTHHPALAPATGLGSRHIPEVSPYAPPVPLYYHEYEDISSNLTNDNYSFIGQPLGVGPNNAYYYHTTRSPIYYSDRKQVSID